MADRRAEHILPILSCTDAVWWAAWHMGCRWISWYDCMQAASLSLCMGLRRSWPSSIAQHCHPSRRCSCSASMMSHISLRRSATPLASWQLGSRTRLPPLSSPPAFRNSCMLFSTRCALHHRLLDGTMCPSMTMQAAAHVCISAVLIHAFRRCMQAVDPFRASICADASDIEQRPISGAPQLFFAH